MGGNEPWHHRTDERQKKMRVTREETLRTDALSKSTLHNLMAIWTWPD